MTHTLTLRVWLSEMNDVYFDEILFFICLSFDFYPWMQTELLYLWYFILFAHLCLGLSFSKKVRKKRSIPCNTVTDVKFAIWIKAGNLIAEVIFSQLYLLSVVLFSIKSKLLQNKLQLQYWEKLSQFDNFLLDLFDSNCSALLQMQWNYIWSGVVAPLQNDSDVKIR